MRRLLFLLLSYNWGMETTYDRILNWYKKQPWWGKVLFFGVLILPLFLGVVSFVTSLVPERKIIPPAKTSNSPPFGKVNEALDTRIEDLKKELIAKVDTVRQVGIRAEERRQSIQSAKTMAELDEIKKRFGL